MLDFRLKAFHTWKEMKAPTLETLVLPIIDFQDITYYSAPKTKEKVASLNDVDPELLKTFQKLGIPLLEQERLSNVAMDVVFDSVSIGTTFQNKLKEALDFYLKAADASKNDFTRPRFSVRKSTKTSMATKSTFVYTTIVSSQRPR